MYKHQFNPQCPERWDNLSSFYHMKLLFSIDQVQQVSYRQGRLSDLVNILLVILNCLITLSFFPTKEHSCFTCLSNLSWDSVLAFLLFISIIFKFIVC